MTKRTFITEYIKNFREIGAAAPSSKYLTKKMCESIEFNDCEVIVEYGPGTGVFTRYIAAKMKPGAKLLVIESNQVFYSQLVAEFKDSPTVIVENESAENVAMLLKKHMLNKPDVVISGLPFASLPSEVSRNILHTTKRLIGANGTFITFQYTLLKKSLLARYFTSIIVSREIRNVPPAYVLCCANKVQ